MNTFAKKTVKYLKLFSILIALLLLNTPVYAGELQKESKLYASSLMNSYESSAANSFYWSNDYKTKLQSQIDARRASVKGNSLVERLAAISLGIVMEFTSDNTYNDLIVQ